MDINRIFVSLCMCMSVAEYHMEELRTYVMYDIESDPIRYRVAEVCKDYGLERIQFSAFAGSLTRNMREELCIKLATVIGDSPGRLMVQPVCEKDIRNSYELINEKPADGDNAAAESE